MDKLFNVATFQVSDSILHDDAKFDNKMCVRLASVNDLIAAEEKYH